jgi:hypothetical protein
MPAYDSTMRALVISDTHFGAWTGEDLLRHPEKLALLEPRLDVDELYAAYVRNAWPGTAVLIDTDEPHPRLLRLMEQPSDSDPEPLAAL